MLKQAFVKEAIGYLRPLSPAKKVSKADAEYFYRQSLANREFAKQYINLLHENPIYNLFGLYPLNAINGYILGAINTILARKNAYAVEHPWRSYIPFFGWGKAGQRALDKIIGKENK